MWEKRGDYHDVLWWFLCYNNELKGEKIERKHHGNECFSYEKWRTGSYENTRKFKHDVSKNFLSTT